MTQDTVFSGHICTIDVAVLLRVAQTLVATSTSTWHTTHPGIGRDVSTLHLREGRGTRRHQGRAPRAHRLEATRSRSLSRPWHSPARKARHFRAPSCSASQSTPPGFAPHASRARYSARTRQPRQYLQRRQMRTQQPAVTVTTRSGDVGAGGPDARWRATAGGSDGRRVSWKRARRDRRWHDAGRADGSMGCADLSDGCRAVGADGIRGVGKKWQLRAEC